jgi:hypothetical protein
MNNPILRPLLKIVASITAIVAFLWATVLILVVVNIYIVRTIPYSFSAWIVRIQLAGWPQESDPSPETLILRFWVVTGFVVVSGLTSAIILRRTRSNGVPDT